MEHSTYAEQIVRVKSGGKVFLQIGIIMLSALVLSIILLIPQIAVLIPALAVLIILLAVLLVRNVNIEYEYAVAESQLTVDMIRGKSSRKRVFTTDVKNFDLLAMPENEGETAALKSRVQTVYDVAGDGEGDIWYALFSSGGETGRTLLLFRPNSRVLGVILRYVPPRNIKKPIGK